MSITWTPHITVEDLDEDRVTFSATCLDSETGISLTFSGGTGIVKTTAHKRAMEDTVWANYQKYLSDKAGKDAKISAWLDEAKTNLEARE